MRYTNRRILYFTLLLLVSRCASFASWSCLRQSTRIISVVSVKNVTNVKKLKNIYFNVWTILSRGYINRYNSLVLGFDVVYCRARHNYVTVNGGVSSSIRSAFIPPGGRQQMTSRRGHGNAPAGVGYEERRENGGVRTFRRHTVWGYNHTTILTVAKHICVGEVFVKSTAGFFFVQYSWSVLCRVISSSIPKSRV